MSFLSVPETDPSLTLTQVTDSDRITQKGHERGMKKKKVMETLWIFYLLLLSIIDCQMDVENSNWDRGSLHFIIHQNFFCIYGDIFSCIEVEQNHNV